MSLLDKIKNFNINVNIFKKEKNIIIDPISCLIKLSILNLYPDGTKISISDNSITFSDPNVLQGGLRFLNGDAREDLHNLFKPIQKSLEWYSDDIKYNNKIDLLYDMSQKGLIKLKKCYDENSTIQHSIDYYISYIKSYCNKKRKKNSSNQKNQNSNNNNNNNNNIDVEDNNNDKNNDKNNGKNNDKNDNNKNINRNIENNITYKYLKNLWTERELNIVVQLFEEYKIKENQEEKENIINTIINLTNTKEKLLNNFLKEQSSIL